MTNSTQYDSFILAVNSDSVHIRYFYLFIITVLYISICFGNILLIVVICTERSLHKPMYMFMCSLFVNDLYGSTALFPAVMTNLLSDNHSISNMCCFLQIFCIYTYGAIEFSNLAVMSYDRYLAICYPLQYNATMTPKKVCILICFLWMYAFVSNSIHLSLTIRLKLCGNVIDKVYCDNYLVVKLACSTADATVDNIVGLIGFAWFVSVNLFAILFSYTKILTICLKSSIETRKKAFSTCTPHLASLLNYSFGSFLNILQSRFDQPMKFLPAEIKAILSVYFLMFQPIFNPVIYGVRMSKIRQACKNILPVGIYHKT